MKYKSVFDIIGPIMIGPSSSHTAGAVRIGLIARKIFGKTPDRIKIIFYRSFAETYKGHATDVAIIGGLLNFSPDNPQIRDSINFAKNKNIKIEFSKSDDFTSHPNTVKIELYNKNEKFNLIGVSIGGGAVNIIEIDGFNINFSAENPTLFIFHKDIFGAVASIATILANHEINISHMITSRLLKGDKALMVIETDQKPSDKVINEISYKENITKVIYIEKFL